jgi:hypothetical protein
MCRLQAENDSLRVQFRRLGELEADLTRMSRLNEQMQNMLGVDMSAAVAGVDSSARGGGVTGERVLGGPGDSRENPGGDDGAHPTDTGSGPSRRETGTD